MDIYIGKNAVARFCKDDCDGTNLVSSDVIAIRCEEKESVLQMELDGGRTLILCGSIYSVELNGERNKFNAKTDAATPLKTAFANSVEHAIGSVEGRYLGIIIDANNQVCIFPDKFNTKDLFYFIKGEELIASTSLSAIAPHLNDKVYDQAALANMLGVYGNYSPKQHTIYKEIKRLAVGEELYYAHENFSFRTRTYEPKATEEYGDEKLEEYAEILRSSVEVRASDSTNWIYMSSGWDSSSVLSVLCDLCGPSKVRAVIARFKYSTESGINNTYEIERAQKITDYFSVPLDIVDIDYTSTDYLAFWEKIREDFKSNHLYAFTTYNFFRLADYISQNSEPTDAVFNGEVSDGAHNLGFSQFATILEHQDLNFREYSDKMASYLYGPSFFKLIEKNDFSDDAIFKLLKSRKDESIIDSISELSDKDWKYKYIASFFLSAHRMPFADVGSSGMLTTTGKEQYQSEIYGAYFQDFADSVTPETLYAWILHLYNSFHWQGSTVRGMLVSPEYNRLQTSSPFWDSRMQDFLAAMPESWGRGLELNPTKYPLKWMLKNKVDYPLHLQAGPHSYLYDVSPSWSADADILYGSAGKEYFMALVRDHKYEEILDPEFFDLRYINNLVDDYCSGVRVSGQQLADLKNIICLCNVGWY